VSTKDSEVTDYLSEPLGTKEQVHVPGLEIGPPPSVAGHSCYKILEMLKGATPVWIPGPSGKSSSVIPIRRRSRRAVIRRGFAAEFPPGCDSASQAIRMRNNDIVDFPSRKACGAALQRRMTAENGRFRRDSQPKTLKRSTLTLRVERFWPQLVESRTLFFAEALRGTISVTIGVRVP
jgi:hypothetical protein